MLHSPHFPSSCSEVAAPSWTFPMCLVHAYCHDSPSSGCSCRRVSAYSHKKLKADKVNNLEAVRQPTLWFTLFEHLLQFSVKKCFTKIHYCLHRTAVKIRAEHAREEEKVCKFIRKDFNHTVILNRSRIIQGMPFTSYHLYLQL